MFLFIRSQSQRIPLLSNNGSPSGSSIFLPSPSPVSKDLLHGGLQSEFLHPQLVRLLSTLTPSYSWRVEFLVRTSFCAKLSLLTYRPLLVHLLLLTPCFTFLPFHSLLWQLPRPRSSTLRTTQDVPSSLREDRCHPSVTPTIRPFDVSVKG